MPTNEEKDKAEAQANGVMGIAPLLIGIDLSSVLFAITDLKESLMDKFLITTEQLESLTASIDAVKDVVDSESVEIKTNLQFVMDALKVPGVDISAQIEALEAIKTGVDALSDAIVVDAPVVGPPVEPTPDVPVVEPPVL